MMTIKTIKAIAIGAAVLAGLAGLTAPAAAQGGVNLTPWLGLYVPTNNQVESVGERDVSAMGGARLEFWGTPHFGFEVTGGYAPARVAGETINAANTNLLAASGRVLLALSPPTSTVGLVLGAGPALLSRGSNPFDNDASSTDFGAAAGVGFRFRLGQSSPVALRLDIEDYMYGGDFGGGDEFQHDLVGSLGLSIPLGGRAD